MTTIVLLYCTAPDTETAKMIVKSLVQEKVAACVNILAPMTSCFEWAGVFQTETEIAFIVKTTDDRAAEARDKIIALHPYDTPCVVALQSDAAGSSAKFLEWIRIQTQE